MIYVCTSILGGFDNLRAPLCASTGARFICFTDNPLQAKCDPWEFRPAPQILGCRETDCGDHIDVEMSVPDAARSSRLPKIIPHLFLPDDCEYSIWHDANFQLQRSPEHVVDTLLKSYDWAAHKHPARNCVYDEARVLLSEKIGTAHLVERDVSHMRTQGHPEGFGLWANGFIARRHTRQTDELSERWWEIFAAGCERDQIAFPPALRQRGMSINTIVADVYRSPWMKFNWHSAFMARDDNPKHWAERRRMAARLARIEELTGVQVPYKVNVPEGK